MPFRQLPPQMYVDASSHCMHVFFPLHQNLRVSIHMHIPFIQSFSLTNRNFLYRVIKTVRSRTCQLQFTSKDLYECELIFQEEKFLITITSSETKIIRHFYEFCN
jgi:hypothetical protein